MSTRGSRLVLALMSAVLLAYVLVHPPVTRLIREILGIETVCALCGPGVADVASALSAMLLITAALFAAQACLHGARLRRYERLPAVGVLWYGWLAVPAAWVGWTGDLIGAPLLRAPVGPLLAAVPSLLVIVLVARRGWLPWSWAVGPWTWTRHVPRDGLTWCLAAVAAVLLTASAAVSAQVAPHRFDELGYHAPIAILYWRDGSLGAFLEEISGYALAHPGSAELLYGLVHLIGGEPLASISQLPFAFLAAAGVAAFARRSGLRADHARLARLSFLVAPIVVIQAGFRNNDLVAAAVLIVVAALAVAPIVEWDRRRALLVGFGLGLMAGTKLAMLPAIAAILAYLVVAWAWDRRQTGRLPSVRLPARLGAASMILLVGALLLASAPWLMRGLELYGNPLFPADIPLLGLGAWGDAEGKDLRYVPFELLWPLYPLLEPHNHVSGLGTVYAVTIIPGLFLALRWSRQRPLVLLAILLLVSLPPWWFLTRHEPRFLLGLFGLSFALIPWVVAGLAGRWRAAGAGLIGVAAIASAAITLSGPISDSASLPRDPVELYAQEWGADPVVLSLPEEVPLLLDDRCGGSYPRLYPHFGPSQERRLVRIGCDTTTEEIAAILLRERISHVHAVARAADVTFLDERYPDDRFELLHRAPQQTPTHTLEGRLYRLRGP